MLQLSSETLEVFTLNEDLVEIKFTVEKNAH